MGVRGPQGPRGPTGPRVSIAVMFQELHKSIRFILGEKYES